MLTTSVKWVGLTSMIMDIRGRARAMMPRTNKMTKTIGGAIHDRYVDNLSGSRPSTDLHLLPVGVRSGTLLEGARSVQINQYKIEERNEVPYAGFIENGTRYMTARRPLGDAVDQVSKDVPGEMNNVLVDVWKIG